MNGHLHNEGCEVGLGGWAERQLVINILRSEHWYVGQKNKKQKRRRRKNQKQNPDYTYHYTVTTRMTPALRRAAMRAV